MLYTSAQIRQMPWLPRTTILVVLAGSRAYGLNREDSDHDVRGLFIPPKQYYLGFLHRIEQVEMKADEGESCLYAIHRFFQLAADCNPNIIEILWSPPLYETPVSQILTSVREGFLSKKARYTFSGYAMAQLKRIHTHRKWLLDPPTAPPIRADFGLPETALLSADIMGAIQALEKPKTMGEKAREGIAINRTAETPPVPLTDRFPAHVMETYAKERAYHNKMKEWQQYCQWKKNRNPARAATEAQFGYDTKHAMHLVRLMRMCEEILLGKGVIVRRPDADELMAVRNGAWSYEQLMEFATQYDEKIATLYETCPLPREPNRELLNRVCIETTEGWWEQGDYNGM